MSAWDGRNGQCGNCTTGTATATAMPADAAVDVHAKHAADSPRLRVLRDPEARKAEFFKYQKTVQEYEAKHAAGQLKPQEAKPEHAPPETRDKPDQQDR